MSNLELFDYSEISANLQSGDVEYLEQCAVDIEIGGRITVEGIMRIGKRLNDARGKFGDNDKAFGQWRKGRLPWLEYQTALNFMRVYSKFGAENLPYNNYRVENLTPTILYALAAPSTPDSVIQQALDKADSGEKVTVADVKDWKAEYEQEKKRSGEWKEQSQFYRKRFEQTQVELLNVKKESDKPPVEVEVIPADYESLKETATKLHQELAELKRQQSKLVEDQIRTRMQGMQNEVDDLERKKQSFEKEVDRLKDYYESIDNDVKRIEAHRHVIETNRLNLINLAAFLAEIDPIGDNDTIRQWLSLADMHKKAAESIAMVFGYGELSLIANVA